MNEVNIKMTNKKKVKRKIAGLDYNFSNEESDVFKFRKKLIKKGYELVDITQLCEFKLGRSGSANNFNEPNEEIYHIQAHYREEQVAVFQGNSCYEIDDDKYIVWTSDENFIIFKKAKIEKEKGKV